MANSSKRALGTFSGAALAWTSIYLFSGETAREGPPEEGISKNSSKRPVFSWKSVRERPLDGSFRNS
jgi:hypothetical protein